MALSLIPSNWYEHALDGAVLSGAQWCVVCLFTILDGCAVLEVDKLARMALHMDMVVLCVEKNNNNPSLE